MNIAALFGDAANIVRLRFDEAGHYRYSPTVTAAAITAIGVSHAAFFSQIAGGGFGVLAFAVILALLRWLLLARAVSAVLQYFGSPPLPLYGYTLAGNLLVLPSLGVFYFAEAGAVLHFWLIWTFWAQAAGFARIGRQSLFKVLAAYAVYLPAVLLAGNILFGLFAAAGWLNPEHITQNFTAMLQELQNGQDM